MNLLALKMTKADELVALIEASDSADVASEEKATETVKLITDLACSSAEAQARLGKVFVFQYLIDVAFYHAGSRESLVIKALIAWIHLCRREILNKQTPNQDNLSLSENHFTTLLELEGRISGNSDFDGQFCVLVMILASDSPKRQVALGQLGFPKAIVHILQRNLLNPEVIEMGLRAVRNVSIHDANAALFMENGIGNVIIYILQVVIKGTFQANILEAVLYAIINLCDDENTARQLGHLGVLDHMLTILPTILQDGDMCNVCCAAFRNLLIVPDNIKRVLSTSICELLMEVLRLHKGDSDTADAAIWALANLSGDRLIRHRLAVVLRVMPLLRDVFLCGVDTYPEDIELGPVAQGISFLIYILSYDPTEDKSNAEEEEVVITPQLSQALAQDGAGELLSMFLHRYLTREAMVESCHRAIITLTRGGGSIVKNALATHKVVDGIIPTLREHVQVLETTVFGLSALLQIISDDDKSASGENGNLLQLREHAASLPEILRMVLVEHRKHDEVASSVIQLMLLLQNNVANRVQLVGALSAAGVLKENDAMVVDGKLDVDKVDVLRAAYNLPAICTVLGMSTADLPAPPTPENEGDDDEAGDNGMGVEGEEEEEEDNEETQRLKQQVLAKLFGGGGGGNLSMEDAAEGDDDAGAAGGGEGLNFRK